jgi:hypothetical protein
VFKKHIDDVLAEIEPNDEERKKYLEKINIDKMPHLIHFTGGPCVMPIVMRKFSEAFSDVST